MATTEIEIDKKEFVKKIVERAEKQFPDDYVMQEHIIQQQIEALERVRKIKMSFVKPVDELN